MMEWSSYTCMSVFPSSHNFKLKLNDSRLILNTKNAYSLL